MVAVDAVVEAAKEMRDAGDFSSLTGAPAELNEWLGEG